MRNKQLRRNIRSFWLEGPPTAGGLDQEESIRLGNNIDVSGEDLSILTDVPDSTKKLEESGVLLVTGPVEDGTLTPIISSLLCKHMDQDWKSEVQIFINSPGGSAPETWALVDMMNFVRMPVVTIGSGVTMSAGATLLAAGDEGLRFCFPNTVIMVHQFYWGVSGKYIEIKDGQTAIEQEYEREIRFWTTHSKLRTEKEVRQYLLGPTDAYLKPERALELGIIDGIIPYKTYIIEAEKSAKKKKTKRKQGKKKKK